MVRLSPQTRFKAGYRSLFFPGWGQIYGGNTFKGVVFSVVQVGLLVGTAVTSNDYNQSKDTADLALNNYERYPTEDNYRIYQQALNQSRDDYNTRNTMVAVTAGFWIYNILDAIIFFQPKAPQVEIKPAPYGSLFDLDNMMVSVTWNL